MDAINKKTGRFIIQITLFSGKYSQPELIDSQNYILEVKLEIYIFLMLNDPMKRV